jgi:phospholipid/cholesterol/gamma-HCH transport system substrate-binding protein
MSGRRERAGEPGEEEFRMRDDVVRADVRVGAFVLAALVLLIAGSLWIAGSSWFAPRRIDYVVRMADSGGIQPGDRVRVAGVPMGKIRDVELRPGDELPVSFRISVRQEVPISVDASARVMTSGMLGTAFLQIEPGSPGARRLEPGGEIRGEGAMGFEDVMVRLAVTGEDLRRVLVQASDILSRTSADLEAVLAGARRALDEENLSNLRALLAGLNQMADSSGPRLVSLLDRLDSVAVSAETGLDALPDLASKVEGVVDDLGHAIGQDGERLTRLLTSAESSLGSADEALSTLGDNRREIEGTLRDLRETAANLRSFSQTVKERPYSLVRIRHAPERRPGDGAP